MMRNRVSSVATARLVLTCLVSSVAAAAAACSGGTDSTGPDTAPDALQLTTKDIGALDSTGQVITQANPGNGRLKSLVDSTLLVFTVGIEARRLDVTTNLTTKPLYFVGVHRVITRSTGSFSTWTVVGMDDPSKLTSLVEVSGFAESATATAPTSVSSTIGGGGFVNGLLLGVGAAGAVTEWRATTGTVSFTSGTAGAACPNYPASSPITCALETLRVRFSINAPSGSGSEGARSATIDTEVDVPTMRLTYAP